MTLKTGKEYLDSIQSLGLEAHILGEKTDLPWYNVITEHNNYRAKVPATSEVYSIL